MKILIASRDAAIRELVTDTLSNSINDVISVTSVKDFFEVLTENNVDFIIYHLDLTPLSAADAFLIERVYHSRIPSILIANDEKFEVTKAMFDMGVIYRMMKPVDRNHLIQIWKRVYRSKLKKSNYGIRKNTNDLNFRTD